MDDKAMHLLAARGIEAWNSQDVDRVLACYTEDLVYRGPNSRGPIEGAVAMRRYLRRLFEAWEMHWTLDEVHAFADRGGCAALWRASFRKPGGDRVVETDGMDLVMLGGRRVKRNEVYFDRAVLASLA